MMRITKPTHRMHSTYKATINPALNQRKQSTQQQQSEEFNGIFEIPQFIHSQSTQQQPPQRQPRFQESFMLSSCPRAVIAPSLIPAVMSAPIIPLAGEVPPQLKIISAKNLFTASSSKLIDLENTKNSSLQTSNLDQGYYRAGAPLPFEKPIVLMESIRPKANSAWSPALPVKTPWNASSNGEINLVAKGQQPVVAFTRTSPNNIHLEALNQFALCSQNRGISSGERVHKYTKWLGPEKPIEKKDINSELQEEDLEDRSAIQHSSSLQRKNDIIQRRIPSILPKNVQQQSSSSSSSLKSPQPTTGLIHRPYQSKQLGFAFKPSVPSSSFTQFSVKYPGLNLKSSRSPADSNGNIISTQSSEQIARKISTTNQQIIPSSNNNSSSSPKAPQQPPYEQNLLQSQQQHSFRKLRAVSNEKHMDQQLLSKQFQKKNKLNTMNFICNADKEPETNNCYDNDIQLERKPHNSRKITHQSTGQQQQQQPQHSIESNRSQNSAGITEKHTSFPQRQYRILSRNIANMSENKKNNKINSNSYQIATNTWKVECSQSPLQQSSQSSSSPSFSSQVDVFQQVAKTLSLNKMQSFNERDNKIINMNMWQPSNEWTPDSDQTHNIPGIHAQQPNSAVGEADKTSNIGSSCSNNAVSSQVVKIGKKMIKIINPYRDRKALSKSRNKLNELGDQSEKLLMEKNAEIERTVQQHFYFGGIGKEIECIPKQIGSSNKNRSYPNDRNQQQQSSGSSESTKENEYETKTKKIIPLEPFESKDTDLKGCNSARDSKSCKVRISQLSNDNINHVNILSISNKQRNSLGQKQNQFEGGDMDCQMMTTMIAKEKRVVSSRMLTEMLARVQQNNNILSIQEQRNDGNLPGHAEDIHRKILNNLNSDHHDYDNEFEVIVQVGNNDNDQDESYSMSSTLREIVQLIAQ